VAFVVSQDPEAIEAHTREGTVEGKSADRFERRITTLKRRGPRQGAQTRNLGPTPGCRLASIVIPLFWLNSLRR
jgi:hypothetical protein